MTPAEGAFYIGVPNLIMVRYGGKPIPPFHQYALAFRPLTRVVWSIVGAGGRTEAKEMETVLDLARNFPNICGVFMDDFFKRQPDDEEQVAVYTPDEIKAIKNRLIIESRKLDLWVTLYKHNLDLPDIVKHLEQCDVITFWTWNAKGLKNLEENLDRLDELIPTSRKVLGCYMWDYGGNGPIPISLMQHQCQLGLNWLREDRIEGIIFLASCICDMELKAVEWTRRWIQEVGGECLPIE